MDPLPEGIRIDIDRIEPDPERVLIEYDGPRFFVGHIDRLGLDVLAFSYDGDERTLRCIVVPTTPDIIEGLENGSLTVRDSLTRTTSRPWLVDLDATTWSVDNAVSPPLGCVPDHYFPKPHLMLRADLQPLLTLRMEGPQLSRGSTPRDAALHGFKNVPEALKRLLDFLLEQGARTGRPQDPVRALYGLSAQRFAFSSFEISYRRPAPGLSEDADAQSTISELAVLLNKSLREAAGHRVDTDDVERRVLLEAAYKLAPPARGVVHAVRFGGSMVGRSDDGVVLTRKTRSRVKQLLTEIESPEKAPSFFAVEGHVGDIDFDAMTVELRDLRGIDKVNKVITYVEPDLLDEVAQLGVEGSRVHAFGERTTHGNFYLTGIFKTPSQDESGT